MKKRIKALFMALLMLISTVFVSVNEIQIAKADSGITIRFHYQKTDGDYEDWNLWIWGAGDGTANDFTGTDDFGVYLDYAVEAGDTELGYIVRKGEWLEKDVESDRFIDMSAVISGSVEVFLKTGVAEPEIDYSKATLGCKVKTAKATSKTTINVELTAEPEVDVNTAFKVFNSSNEELAITSVDANGLSIDLTISGELDYKKSYQLTFDGNTYNVVMPDYYSTDDFESQYTYDGNDLGATWSSNSTTFKVWAPTAESVSVKLYESGTKGTNDLKDSYKMNIADKGVWEVTVDGNLNGTYYTYEANVGGNTNETIDPYAVTAGVNGDRGMVIDLDSTDPEGWDKDKNPNSGKSYTDAVIYELHVRDFSYDTSSGIKNVGKYLAFTENGTTNSEGKATGVDYLKDLGITHLHILPSYDYATVNESSDVDQFNWGYDPKNYNVPEGSYSTDPYNGAVRVNEY